MIATLRAYYRLLAFAFITIYYASKLIISSIIFGMVPARATRIRQQWGIAALKTLNVKIELEKPVPEGAHLFVANHRSYIEGAVLPRFIIGSIVIKKEVGDWPILGYGARASFSIMVDRKDPDSRRKTREQIVELIKKGYSVTIFPEGTTYAGPGVGPLRAGPFQAAEGAGISVVPVALEYDDPTDAWIGDDTFVCHFLKCFRRKEIRMKLKFGEPFFIDDWEQGMQRVQDWIQNETLRMWKEFGNDKKAGV